MFKNVSFGQLGITNIPDFKSVFDGSMIFSLDIEEMIESALSLSSSKRVDLIIEQQRKVAVHTYDKKLKFISDCFDRI